MQPLEISRGWESSPECHPGLSPLIFEPNLTYLANAHLGFADLFAIYPFFES